MRLVFLTKHLLPLFCLSGHLSTLWSQEAIIIAPNRSQLSPAFCASLSSSLLYPLILWQEPVLSMPFLLCTRPSVMPFYFPWEELPDLLSTHCTHHEGYTIFLGAWKAELMLGAHTLPRLAVTTPASYANNCKSFLSIPFYAVRNYNGWWALIYSQTYLFLPSCLNKALQVSSPCIWTSAQVSSSCFFICNQTCYPLHPWPIDSL